MEAMALSRGDRVDVVLDCGGREARSADAVGASVSTLEPQQIPPEVALVEGCNCKPGGYSRLHRTDCAVNDLGEAEYERRHDVAAARVADWVRGLNADAAMPVKGLERWRLGAGRGLRPGSAHVDDGLVVDDGPQIQIREWGSASPVRAIPMRETPVRHSWALDVEDDPHDIAARVNARLRGEWMPRAAAEAIRRAKALSPARAVDRRLPPLLPYEIDGEVVDGPHDSKLDSA